MEKLSSHVGRKHDLLVDDAVYTTNGVADHVHHGDGCRYIVACGDKQECTVVTADGDVDIVHGRNMRAVKKGDVIHSRNKSPVLIVRVHGIAVIPPPCAGQASALQPP